MNSMQTFKLIFNFQAGGIILLETDSFMMNLKLFTSKEQRTYVILLYIIGALLLALQIHDIKRQRDKIQLKS